MLESAKSELNKNFSPEAVRELFDNLDENLPKSGISLAQIIKRNNITAKDAQKYLGVFEGVSNEVLNILTIELKYQGYIEKEEMQIELAQNKENKQLPYDFDYNTLSGLRLEARQKLNDIKPLNIGQASRISGVSPADIAILLCYFK